MKFICIKQHLSSIWTIIHEKVLNNTEVELKKDFAYKKKFIINIFLKYIFHSIALNQLSCVLHF